MEKETYLLTTIIDGECFCFCKDRKWRSRFGVYFGTFKECAITYNRPNNGTTMGNRLLTRKFISNFKIRTLDEINALTFPIPV